MTRATLSTSSCLAVMISARLAAVVRSVSSVPRSFSPASVSVATTAPPDIMKNIRSIVSMRPMVDPATWPAFATFDSSTRPTSAAFTPTPEVCSRVSRVEARSVRNSARRRSRAAVEVSLSARKRTSSAGAPGTGASGSGRASSSDPAFASASFAPASFAPASLGAGGAAIATSTSVSPFSIALSSSFTVTTRNRAGGSFFVPAARSVGAARSVSARSSHARAASGSFPATATRNSDACSLCCRIACCLCEKNIITGMMRIGSTIDRMIVRRSRSIIRSSVR